MFKLLPSCLALLAIAIGESADVQLRANDTRSIEQQYFRPQTLLSLETWVSSQFDLPAIHEHPSIEFASPSKIVSLRFAGLLSDPGERGTERSSLVCSTRHDRHLLRRHAHYLSARGLDRRHTGRVIRDCS